MVMGIGIKLEDIVHKVARPFVIAVASSYLILNILGCNSQATPTPNQTPTPKPSPTQTYNPTPTITITPEPTITPVTPTPEKHSPVLGL